MLTNAFSERRILPPNETDPDKNRALIESFLGPKAAERFATLDTGKPKATHDDFSDLKGEAESFKQETFLERSLDIDQAYAEQKLLLFDLLETLSNGEQGIKDKEGNEYPFPTLEQVKTEVENNKEIFETKAKQGFTELQITHFALPTKRLFDSIEKEILIQHKKGTLHSTDGTKLDLDTSEPLYQWEGYEKQEPVYFPTSFDKEHHGGKTKKAILDSKTSTFPGFLVSFQEKAQTIPREGQDETIGNRPRIEAGKSPNAYLDILKQPEYEHESGLTIEEWAIRFLTALRKDGTVLYDYNAKDTDGNENASACINLATFFPAGGDVSNADWIRGYRQASVGGYDARGERSSYGAGSSVRVGTP
jgi:hypothetical protein